MKLTEVKYFIVLYDSFYSMMFFYLSKRMLINFLIFILILKNSYSYNYLVKVPNIQWPLLTFKQYYTYHL